MQLIDLMFVNGRLASMPKTKSVKQNVNIDEQTNHRHLQTILAKLILEEKSKTIYQQESLFVIFTIQELKTKASTAEYDHHLVSQLFRSEHTYTRPTTTT